MTFCENFFFETIWFLELNGSNQQNKPNFAITILQQGKWNSIFVTALNQEPTEKLKRNSFHSMVVHA